MALMVSHRNLLFSFFDSPISEAKWAPPYPAMVFSLPMCWEGIRLSAVLRCVGLPAAELRTHGESEYRCNAAWMLPCVWRLARTFDQWKKNLVVFIIWGLSYFQDPFEPASIMECHKVFFHCSHVPTRAAALSIKTGHGHRELTGAHHFRPWILEGNFLKWRFRKWAEWKLGCALLGVAWIDI